MSTRGVIARTKGDGWEGRFHHWDSYPQALGATLWELYHGFFNKDTKAMIKFLIDDHLGWDTINGCDFTKPAGYNKLWDLLDDEHRKGPQCYCHGDSSIKDPEFITDQNSDCLFMEWIYVLSGHYMTIFTNKYVTKLNPNQHVTNVTNGFYIHIPLMIVNLDGIEPDWEAVHAAGELLCVSEDTR